MKNYFLIIFYSSVLLLVSCQQEKKDRKFVIGFSQCTGLDAWRRQMLVDMKGELAFHPEISLEYKDAENSSKRQIKDIEGFIEARIDLLIVSPNEAEPITPVVENAYKAGIPVIVIDRKTNSNMYSAYIGANNYEIGKLAGEYIAKLLEGKGKILEVWGLRGSSPAQERHKGLTEVLGNFPAIEIVAEIDGKWEVDTAQRQIQKHHTSLPAFDLVFAHNDIMAYGAHQVLSQNDPDNRLKFIGIDALPGPRAGIQFVSDRILTASFLYPTGGEEAIRIASQILNGKPFEKENILLSTVVDYSNVRVMKLQSDKILNQQKDIVRQQEKINDQIEVFYSQRVLIYILLGSLVVTIIAGSFAAFSWKEKNEANKRLEVKSEEILQQRNTIAEMAEKAERYNQEKLNFFTNISHEFKTPITLILGPIEELLSKGSEIKAGAKENLFLIKKNALRLLRLVNQLMDFRKIEEKKMMLQASEQDLVEFIKDVMTAFEKIAQKRKIDFRLITENKQLYVWFDPDMIDKVIFNLLSNAFKFTHDKGRIHIHIGLEPAGNRVTIQLEDNGVGMSEEFVLNAFDRFHTGGSFGGTGLGLSLSKEFIDLHHGELFIKSEKGKGTMFTIMLPLGKEHFDEKQVVSTNVDWFKHSNYELTTGQEMELYHTDSSADFSSKKDHTLLLIEDNNELREFLKKRFQPFYNIEEAGDGATGLQQAFQVVPNLIISDVSLPGMSGIELSKKLKGDLRTSHIPIIILTVKGSIEQRIEGMQTGADEYITKPFVFEYLMERVKGLIKNREVLKEHYSHDLNIETHHLTMGALDKKFINDFTVLIERNIGNPELNVNEIGRDLGMSRVQLYRKVKALLGYSVNDYIINVRLKKAKHLLLETDRSVAEIASEVGFSSPTYFSTAFKNKFNLTPKDFKAVQH